jgi:hypothetical protein
MVDQRFEECNIPEGSLLAKYVQGQRVMDGLEDGAQLRAAACSVLKQLPDGPIMLVATSGAGAGLAATCAAMRDQPTAWRRIDLATDSGGIVDPVVVVDPVDAGDGWRSAIARRWPTAVFVKPLTADVELGLAA